MHELVDAPAANATPGRSEIFRSVFQHSPTPTLLTGLDGRCLYVNSAMTRLTGFPEAVLRRKGLRAILAEPEDATSEEVVRAELLSGDAASYRVEQQYMTADGRKEWCQKAVSVLRDADETPLMFVVQIDDISERKQVEERLRHLAEYDSLTGLRNRRVFEDDLDVQVCRCKRYGERAALLVIDVDGFKQINDNHGHLTGDKVLIAVSDAIRGRVRASDVAARIGGDEFAVLLAHVDRRRARRVIEDLRRVLGECAVQADGAIVSASASIGAALLDDSTETGATALHDADLDMYRAKRARRRSEERLLAGSTDPLLAA